MRDLVAEITRLRALSRATRRAEYEAERNRVAEEKKQFVDEMDRRLSELDTKIAQVDDDDAALERLLEFIQSHETALGEIEEMSVGDGDIELPTQRGRAPESQGLETAPPSENSGFANFVSSLPGDAAHSAEIAAIMLDAPAGESWEKRDITRLVLLDAADRENKSTKDSVGRALDRMVDRDEAEKREDGRYTRGPRVADALSRRAPRPKSRAQNNGHGGTVAGLSRKAMRMEN